MFLLAFFFYSPTDNWRWDPSFYYAQLRSPIIDGDFDFSDETIPPGGIKSRTARGLPPSPYPVGPSLLWSPLFLLAHAISLLVKPGFANGFNKIYIGLVSGSSAALGILGVLVNYRLNRLVAGRNLALLASVLALFATPLVYYIFRQPIMAHSSSFLVTSALILACILFERGKIPYAWSGALLGFLTGMNVIMRWTSWVYFIPAFGLLILPFGPRKAVPLSTSPDSMQTSKSLPGEKTSEPGLKAKLIQTLLFVVFALIGISPQLATWFQLHGRWLVNPVTNLMVDLDPRRYYDLFFQSGRGLLFWSPFTFFGLLGLVFLPDRRTKWLLIASLLLFCLPFGLKADWFGGGGFGARYFLETVPMATIGFTALFTRSFSKKPVRLLLISLSSLVIIHQISLMVAVEGLASLDWLDYQAYTTAQPLGVQFHLETILNFLRNPMLLLGIRPHVGIERQAVVANLFAGVQGQTAYAIPLLGTLVMTLSSVAFAWLDKLSWGKALPYGIGLAAIFQLAWFAFYLSV